MEHGHAHEGRVGWAAAAQATLHCLTGCAIGEVLGMALATWWGWPDLPSIALAVALAFFFGYLLTFLSVRRAGLTVADAVRAALAADTVSILVMEIVDNGFLLAVPGAMEAGLASGLFWWALALALAVADHVCVLSAGQFVFQGTPQALAREPEIMNQHLGVARGSSHESV